MHDLPMHYWIEVSELQRQRLSRQSAYYASRGSILTMFTWVTFILMFFCIQTRCLTLHMKNTWVFVTLCKARQQKILCRWVMNAYFGLCLCTILLAERKFKAPAVMVCRIAQLVYAYTSLYKQHQLGFNIVRTQNAGVVLDPGFLAVLSSNVSVWATPPERVIDAAVLQADLYSVLHSSVAGIKPAHHGIVALHHPGTQSRQYESMKILQAWISCQDSMMQSRYMAAYREVCWVPCNTAKRACMMPTVNGEMRAEMG